MADVRIQDFGENANPDRNNDFVMSFNGNAEYKTRLRDFYYAMVPDGAQQHNSVFRGKALGALTSTHIANIQNGTFRDMFIGDTFSINGSNYVIAGFNYKKGHGDNISLGNHVVLMNQRWAQTPTETLNPDGSTTHFMNDTDTAAGGFANTKLYKTYLPQIQTKLESDFGSHLMKFRELLTNSIDDSGAPNNWAWYDAKVGIPNEVMIYGTIAAGNNKNGGYNVGDDTSQLPLMRLDDTERNNKHAGAVWLRDIHSASDFATASNNGHAGWGDASGTWTGVRAFFLIG